MKNKNKISIGYGCMSFLPPLAMIVLQFVVMFIILFGLVFVNIWKGAGALSSGEALQLSYQQYLDHNMLIMVMSQIVNLLVFSLWYYLGFLHGNKLSVKGGIITGRTVAAIGVLALALYCATNVFMNFAGVILPDMMEEYLTMIETAGAADLTVLSTIATLFLAPLGEELIFRGITLKYLEKSGFAFGICNVIQAFLFGLVHMNWVQGIYAFALGLVLGYCVDRYKTLKASVLLHMFFNFLGTYVAFLLDKLPQSWVLTLVVAAAALLFALLALKLMKKDGKIEIEEEVSQ